MAFGGDRTHPQAPVWLHLDRKSPPGDRFRQMRGESGRMTWSTPKVDPTYWVPWCVSVEHRAAGDGGVEVLM